MFTFYIVKKAFSTGVDIVVELPIRDYVGLTRNSPVSWEVYDDRYNKTNKFYYLCSQLQSRLIKSQHYLFQDLVYELERDLISHVVLHHHLDSGIYMENN